MIRYGLKLWSNNKEYIPHAARLHGKNVYDYIELYIVPGTYDRHIKMWRSLNIPFLIHCSHFAHGFNLAIKSRFKENMRIFSESRAFCDELKGRYIIVHPGMGGDVRNSVSQLKSLGDVRILVENKPYLSFMDDRCRGSTYEETKFILKNCKAGFCLDIGHAINTAFHMKVDVFKYVNKMFTLKPSVIHISDGKIGSVYDSHMNIGDGNFDFKKIKRIINRSAAGYLTVETHKNKKDLSDFVQDMRRIKHIFSKSGTGK